MKPGPDQIAIDLVNLKKSAKTGPDQMTVFQTAYLWNLEPDQITINYDPQRDTMKPGLDQIIVQLSKNQETWTQPDNSYHFKLPRSLDLTR